MAEDIFDDLATVSASREVLYSFLSRMFEREVTKELVAELQQKTSAMEQLATLRELGNKKLNDGLDRLESYLKASAPDPVDKTKLDLDVEYAGLFLSVWGRPAHPSESAYATGGKLVMQKQRDQVLQVYRSAGLDKAATFKEPEDHVAIELLFMARMAKECAASAKAHDEKKSLELVELQARFLKDHLGRWIGALADDVVHQGTKDFYKGVSLIAAGFVEEDLIVLQDFVNDLKPSSVAA